MPHRLSLLRSCSLSRLSRFTCWWRELWRDGGILQPKGHCLRPHYCLRHFIIPRISHKRTHLCFSLHFISSVCLCRAFSFSQKMELFILLSRSVHLATDNAALVHRREKRLSLSLSSQSHSSSNAQVKNNVCPYWRYKKKPIKPENKGNSSSQNEHSVIIMKVIGGLEPSSSKKIKNKNSP